MDCRAQTDTQTIKETTTTLAAHEPRVNCLFQRLLLVTAKYHSKALSGCHVLYCNIRDVLLKRLSCWSPKVALVRSEVTSHHFHMVNQPPRVQLPVLLCRVPQGPYIMLAY